MDIGKLNRRITIQQRSTTQDAAGQAANTWSDIGTAPNVWANVLGATGMASIKQSSPIEGVATAMNSYSFRIRYRADVTAGMRVYYNSQPYDIKQVRLDIAGQDWTDLVCEQGGNDG